MSAQVYYNTGDTNHLCISTHIARPLNTFPPLVLSSLYLVGFESSLINFTCPHFCPQLFIGPYYENLNLLFDYWLLPLEACGFWCIIEQSWIHKWLLHTGIKVWVFWTSNHPAEERFPPILSMAYILPERPGIQLSVSRCKIERKKFTTKLVVLQLCIASAQFTLLTGFFIGVWKQ